MAFYKVFCFIFEGPESHASPMISSRNKSINLNKNATDQVQMKLTGITYTDPNNDATFSFPIVRMNGASFGPRSLFSRTLYAALNSSVFLMSSSLHIS